MNTFRRLDVQVDLIVNLNKTKENQNCIDFLTKTEQKKMCFKQCVDKRNGGEAFDRSIDSFQVKWTMCVNSFRWTISNILNLIPFVWIINVRVYNCQQLIKRLQCSFHVNERSAFEFVVFFFLQKKKKFSRRNYTEKKKRKRIWITMSHLVQVIESLRHGILVWYVRSYVYAWCPLQFPRVTKLAVIVIMIVKRLKLTTTLKFSAFKPMPLIGHIVPFLVVVFFFVSCLVMRDKMSQMCENDHIQS